MTAKSKEQELAKDLYLHTGKSQSEIADILNIDRKSLYLWIKNGRWDEMKTAARQAPGIILQDIYHHIDAVNSNILNREPADRVPTMEEVNKLQKLLKMTRDIDRKSAGMYVEAIEELVRYTSRKDIDFCKKLTKVANRYIQATIESSFAKRADDTSREMEKYMTGDDGDFFSVDKNAQTRPVPHIYPTSVGADPFAVGVDPRADRADPCVDPLSRNSSADPYLVPLPRQMWANDGEMPADINAGLKPLPVKDIMPGNDADQLPAFQQKNKLPDGEMASPQALSSVQDGSGSGDTFAAIMALPPASRPSPFREGNILCVTNKDHVNEDERKMSDSVRYYPDIDPYEKFNRAAYQSRIASEQQDKEKQQLAAQKRKAANDAIINMDDYYKYRDLLMNKCRDIREEVVINGKMRNRMAYQHNLLQMQFPEDQRDIVTDEEFLRRRAVAATLASLRTGSSS